MATRLEPLSCDFSGWFYVVTISAFLLVLGFALGLHFGKKAALDELMRKPISAEPYILHANA
jgi:hypothetical protein